MTVPEFSRPIRVDTLGQTPRPLSIAAEDAERAALAARFGLQEVEALSATAELTRNGEIVRARGNLAAQVTQSCVSTGAPVAEGVTADFEIEFRPEHEGQPDEEIELSEGELDVVFYDGAAVDLGEAVAETLSLSLNPFPRCPDADATLAEVGVHKEGEEPRTGALAGLKDLLSKGA